MDEQMSTSASRDTWLERTLVVLGMALMWTHVHNQLMYPATFMFDKDGGMPAYALFFCYLALLCAVSVVIGANHARLTRRLFTSAVGMGVTGALGTLGTILVSSCDFATTPSAILGSMGFGLLACFVPIFFAFWCLRLVALGDGTYARGHVVGVAIALSYVVFCLITAIRLTIGAHARAFSIGYCAATTALAVIVVMRSRPEPVRGEAQIRQLPVNIMVPSLLFVYICTFVIALLNPEVALFDYPQSRAFLYWIDAALAGACAVIFLKMPGATRRASMVTFALLSVYLIGMVLLTAFSASLSFATANFPIIAAKNAFDFLLLLLVLVGSHNRHVDPVWHIALFLVIAYALPSAMSVGLLLAGGLYTGPLEGNASILAIMLVSAFVIAVIANVTLVAFLSRKGRLADANEPTLSEKTAPTLDLAQTAWGLTDRETEIVAAVLTNATTTKIARDLYISEATVYSHLKRIYRKSGAHSRQELIDLVETFGK